MKIESFYLEHWLNPRCNDVKVNLGTSCVKAFDLRGFLDLIDEDKEKWVHDLLDMSLHYGDFNGSERLKNAIAGLYNKVNPEFVLTVHGGTGANNMVLTELLEDGDNIVVITPSYQQHYSIPENLGYEVRKLNLKIEDGFEPNVKELKKQVDKNTKIISFTNPNNPSGTYVKEDKMNQIIQIARDNDAYILSDEIYRGLSRTYMPSIVDLYEKGIVTSSMSKIFSMAGTRVGWIVVNDQKTFDQLFNRRSYDTICGPVFGEYLAALCLENYELVYERAREIIEPNRKALNEWLKGQKHLKLCGESIGTTSLIKFDYDMTGEELCKILYEEDQILLCHGDVYDEPKSFRIGYAMDEVNHFKSDLDKLGKALMRF